jgi:hypothetical protein
MAGEDRTKTDQATKRVTLFSKIIGLLLLVLVLVVVLLSLSGGFLLSSYY